MASIGTMVEVKENGQTSNKLKVNNLAIFSGITLTGLVSSLITLLTFFWIDKPASEMEQKLKETQLILNYFDKTLRSDDETVRKKSSVLLFEILSKTPSELLESLEYINQDIDSTQTEGHKKRRLDLPDWSGLKTNPKNTSSKNPGNEKGKGEVSH